MRMGTAREWSILQMFILILQTLCVPVECTSLVETDNRIQTGEDIALLKPTREKLRKLSKVSRLLYGICNVNQSKEN